MKYLAEGHNVLPSQETEPVTSQLEIQQLNHQAMFQHNFYKTLQ